MARPVQVHLLIGALLFSCIFHSPAAQRAPVDFAKMVLKVRRANGSAALLALGDLEMDRLGNYYVCGHSDGKARYGTNIIDGPPGAFRSFIAKFDRQETILWFRELPGTNSRLCGMAVSGTNAIFVAGHFVGEMEIGDQRLGSRGSGDIFVAMFDGANRLQWVTQAGGNGWDAPTAVAVDSRGNCYVTGRCAGGEEAFDGNKAPLRPGPMTTFIAKYGPDGHRLWLRCDVPSNPSSVALDAAGNIFLTGSITVATNTVDMGTYKRAQTRSAPFLAKYDPNGALLWRKEDRLNRFAYRVAVDADGNPHVAGMVSTGAHGSYGTKPSSMERTNMFLAKYTTDGDLAWVRTRSEMGISTSALF